MSDSAIGCAARRATYCSSWCLLTTVVIVSESCTSPSPLPASASTTHGSRPLHRRSKDESDELPLPWATGASMAIRNTNAPCSFATVWPSGDITVNCGAGCRLIVSGTAGVATARGLGGSSGPAISSTNRCAREAVSAPDFGYHGGSWSPTVIVSSAVTVAANEKLMLNENSPRLILIETLMLTDALADSSMSLNVS